MNGAHKRFPRRHSPNQENAWDKQNKSEQCQYDVDDAHPHDARPVLLNLGEPGGIEIAPWAERVQLIDAQYAGSWELPVIGAVPGPSAVLIRPDGYVAWWETGLSRGSLTR